MTMAKPSTLNILVFWKTTLHAQPARDIVIKFIKRYGERQVPVAEV
jgi:hypothetical protein